MIQYRVVEQYESGRDKNMVAVCKIVWMEGQKNCLSSSFLSIQQWQNHGKHDWRGERWASKTQTERNLEKPLCMKIHFYIMQRFSASHFGRNRKICPQSTWKCKEKKPRLKMKSKYSLWQWENVMSDCSNEWKKGSVNVGTEMWGRWAESKRNMQNSGIWRE